MNQIHSKPHNISLVNREKIDVSGVSDIVSFDENEIILNTSLGELSIDGDNLKITKLSIDDGIVEMTGRVIGLFYAGEAKKKSKFFGRSK